MTDEIKIIFVDDEEHLRNAVAQTFRLAGLDIELHEDAASALGIIQKDTSAIIITDIRMPKMDGIELLNEIMKIDADIPVILVTGHGDVALAVEAMRAGAYDFIEKPFDPNTLVQTAKRGIEKRKITLENRALRSKLSRQDDLENQLTGRSDFVTKLRDQIRIIAPTDLDVLINGETGTGKEVVARAIHSASERKDKPFVAINCGALPKEQMESYLYGHEQGAFLGALRARFGKFELANGGTIFLDAVEEAPKELQLSLLRVLEDRTVQRLGSNETIELDIRIIAASRRDLKTEVAEGRFRQEILQRFNQVEITLLPLSQRKEDIPEIFAELVNEASIKYRKDSIQINQSDITGLVQQSWPGNIRELRHNAERFVLGLNDQASKAEENIDKHNSLVDQMAQHEKNIITATLISQKGSLKQTQDTLKLSRKSLYEKMKKYNLDKKDYR